MLIPTDNKIFDFSSDDLYEGEQLSGESYIEITEKGDGPPDFRSGGFTVSEFPNCCAIMLAHGFNLRDFSRPKRASILKSLPDIAKYLGYTYVLFADTKADTACLTKIDAFRNSRTGNTVTLHGGRAAKSKGEK